MSDGEGPIEELAGKTSNIVVAGATETWPYRKVLLAVLPPTLALLIAVIGVWESSNRDRAAAAEADKDRAAEVAKDQAAAEKDRQVREAALVLPRYETLLAQVRESMSAADVCRNDLDNWLDPGGSGWNDTSIGTAAAAELVDGVEVGGEIVSVNEPFLTSCGPISDLAEFQLSLDKALVVSNSDLQRAATELEDVLLKASDTATHLSKVPRASGESASYIDAGPDLEGLTFRDNVAKLSALLERAEAATDDLVDVVRGVLLPDQ